HRRETAQQLRPEELGPLLQALGQIQAGLQPALLADVTDREQILRAVVARLLAQGGGEVASRFLEVLLLAATGVVAIAVETGQEEIDCRRRWNAGGLIAQPPGGLGVTELFPAVGAAVEAGLGPQPQPLGPADALECPAQAFVPLTHLLVGP